jgi:chaperonin GroEL
MIRRMADNHVYDSVRRRMEARDSQRPVVFVSYSHQDRQWLARLRVHLKPLERNSDVDIWDDSRIDAGAKWKDEIRQALASAKVAVLLVSADFFNSDFIASDELPPLLSAAEGKGTRIIPLHLSPSRFSKTPALSQFQSINDPATPLVDLSLGAQEAVFVKLADAIEKHLFPSPIDDPAGSSSAQNPTATSTPAKRPLPPSDMLLSTLAEMTKEVSTALLLRDKKLHEVGNQITKAIFIGGLQAIANRSHPKRLSRNLHTALEIALQTITKGCRTFYAESEWNAFTFADTEPIERLARYVTRDASVTDMVVNAVKNVALYGPFAIKPRFEIDMRIRPGLQFENGYAHSRFVTDTKASEAYVHRPYVLIANTKLSKSEEVSTLLRCVREDLYDPGGLVVVAEDVVGAALEALPEEFTIIRNRGYGSEYEYDSIERVLVVKAPASGNRRADLLDDIALVTGAKVFAPDHGPRITAASPYDLGRADSVIATSKNTAIIGGRGKRQAIEARIAELKSRRAAASETFERESLDDRILKLKAGIAEIVVVPDDKRKHYGSLAGRALEALASAAKGGIVAGEGLALANAALALRECPEATEEQEAMSILAEALEGPIKALAEEFGRDGEELLRRVRSLQREAGNPDIGYHSDEDAFVDLIEAGAIEPANGVLAMIRAAVEIAARRLSETRFNDELVRQIARYE